MDKFGYILFHYSTENFEALQRTFKTGVFSSIEEFTELGYMYLTGVTKNADQEYSIVADIAPDDYEYYIPNSQFTVVLFLMTTLGDTPALYKAIAELPGVRVPIL